MSPSENNKLSRAFSFFGYTRPTTNVSQRRIDQVVNNTFTQNPGRVQQALLYLKTIKNYVSEKMVEKVYKKELDNISKENAKIASQLQKDINEQVAKSLNKKFKKNQKKINEQAAKNLNKKLKENQNKLNEQAAKNLNKLLKVTQQLNNQKLAIELNKKFKENQNKLNEQAAKNLIKKLQLENNENIALRLQGGYNNNNKSSVRSLSRSSSGSSSRSSTPKAVRGTTVFYNEYVMPMNNMPRANISNYMYDTRNINNRGIIRYAFHRNVMSHMAHHARPNSVANGNIYNHRVENVNPITRRPWGVIKSLSQRNL